VVKTLQDGEVNPPSDYGRSLTGVLHTRATAVVEKYQEREDSIQSGVRTTQVKRVAFPRAKNTKKKNLGICTSIPYLLVMRAVGNGRKLHFSLAS